VDIDILSSFITVAEMQNITLASETLNISPSALSSSLQKLERELGCKLFERSTKGMHLTGSGRFFLEWAKKNSRFREKLEEKLNVSATQKGTLRIGTMIESDTLFIFLSAFQKRHPGVRVELYGEKSLRNNYLLSDLDAFVVAEKDKRDLPGVLLAKRNTLYVLMRETHPLAERDELRLEDLKEQAFVFSAHEGQLEWSYDYCRAQGFWPNVQYLCEEFDGKLDILANSDTLTIGFNTMRLLRESMKGLKAVPLAVDEGMTDRFYLVWRKKTLNPLANLMIDFAMEFQEKGRMAYLEK
jgi:DNA-binding transcriptional LysR family regulator